MTKIRTVNKISIDDILGFVKPNQKIRVIQRVCPDDPNAKIIYSGEAKDTIKIGVLKQGGYLKVAGIHTAENDILVFDVEIN